MIKKLAWYLLICVTVFSLSACSTTAAASPASASTGVSQTGSADQIELSTSAKLAAGILKLEGTDQAVTPAQAKELLPLWKASRSLSTSDTISQAELDGLYEQIKETMTTEQVQAVEALNLDQESMASLMQELGVQAGFGARQASGSSTQTARGSASSGGVPSGGMPGGGAMPSGGGGGGGFTPGGGGGFAPSGGAGFAGGSPPDMGGEMTEDQRATAVASAGSRSRTGALNPFLNALITLLEERAAE